MKRIVLILVAMITIGAFAANAKETNGTLKVQGKCNMCKTNIEKAAKSIAGVTVADWNKETKVLKLRYDTDKVQIESISKAVAKAGYDTNKDKTDGKTYDALPNCCKYR